MPYRVCKAPDAGRFPALPMRAVGATRFLAVALLATISSVVGAQGAAADVVIPWPAGKYETLEIWTRHAAIIVWSSEASEVRILPEPPEPAVDDRGVRRLSAAPRLDVSEEAGIVRVRVRGDDAGSRIRVLVPATTGLRLRASYATIEVTGIRSKLELSTHSGDIRATGAGGLVVADTWGGSIAVGFDSIPTSGTMGFSTHGGSVVLGFPRRPDAEVLISTSRGSLVSDFDAEQLPAGEATPPARRRGRTIHARIGSGGLSLWFKTYSGDVELRRLNALTPTQGIP